MVLVFVLVLVLVLEWIIIGLDKGNLKRSKRKLGLSKKSTSKLVF